MRGAKLLRSGLISPREPLRSTFSSVPSVGVNCWFCPLGTISESDLKSNVAAWSFASLMVVKSS